jgi:hypothetical protein
MCKLMQGKNGGKKTLGFVSCSPPYVTKIK